MRKNILRERLIRPNNSFHKIKGKKKKEEEEEEKEKGRKRMKEEGDKLSYICKGSPYRIKLKFSFYKMIQIAYVTVQNRGAQVFTHSKLPRVLFPSNLDITQYSQAASKVAPCSPSIHYGLPLAKCYFSILY